MARELEHLRAEAEARGGASLAALARLVQGETYRAAAESYHVTVKAIRYQEDRWLSARVDELRRRTAI